LLYCYKVTQRGQHFKFLVSLNFVAQTVKDVKQKVNGDEWERNVAYQLY